MGGRRTTYTNLGESSKVGKRRWMHGWVEGWVCGEGGVGGAKGGIMDEWEGLNEWPAWIQLTSYEV